MLEKIVDIFAFSSIKHGFLTNQSACSVVNVIKINKSSNVIAQQATRF